MSSTVINAKVNKFPSLTWNHLKINNTTLDCNITSPAKSVIEGNGERVTLYQRLLSETLDSTYVRTGLGDEFDCQYDAIVKENGFAVNEFVVQDGTRVDIPVHITYTPENNTETASDTVILAGESSESTFIFYYINDKSFSGVFGNRIKVVANENSVVHIVVVNLLGDNVTVFNSIGGIAKDNANIDITEIELGGNKTYTGSNITLAGYQSKFNGKASYAVVKDHFLDFNQIVEQLGKESVSKFSVDGVIKDNGRKAWRGTIDFKNGCIDAKGDEQEDVLLLSPEVDNRSLPVILCDEEQVEGRHGCTIGRLDLEKLFYMQSRGVDEKSAQELMTKAKIYAVSRDINDEAIVNSIQDYVEGIFAK